MNFVLSLLVNAAALWVAVRIVPGITHTGSGWSLIGVALVFGVLNAVVRPILVFLSFPVLVITLGLFTLVLNAILLWLTGAFSGTLGLGFRVDGFLAAFLGALVVSVVSFALSVVTSRAAA
jgi:putative membrane protein